MALIDRASNDVLERYRYTPFGEVMIEDGTGLPLTDSAYGNDRFFLGRVYDSRLGIYDLRNRWYDSSLGTFLSPDPLNSIDSWNMYQYGFATPGTWMDPWGLSGEAIDIGEAFSDVSEGPMKGEISKLSKAQKKHNKKRKNKENQITVVKDDCIKAGGAVTEFGKGGITIRISSSLFNGSKADLIKALAKLIHEMEHAKNGHNPATLPGEDMNEHIDRRLDYEVTAWLKEAEFVDEVVEWLKDKGEDEMATDLEKSSKTVLDILKVEDDIVEVLDDEGNVTANLVGDEAKRKNQETYIGNQRPTGSGRSYRNTFGDQYSPPPD